MNLNNKNEVVKMRYIIFTILSVFFVHGLFAQTEPSITFDPSTGNYIIRYQNYNGVDREVIFEPATKVEPDVDASALFDPNSGMFHYEYTVKNGLNSQQRLLIFIVDFYSPVENIKNPNQQWRSGLFSYRSTISWGHTMVSSYGVRTPYSGIAPDSSASGFSYTSLGLPAIVKSYSKGATRTLHFIEEPPGEVEMLLDPIERFPVNTVQRKTLGPKDPPDPFVPAAFVDTLISYKHQALDLDWITNQGIANSLDQKLENAKKQLEKGKVKTAVNILNALLNEVEAQKAKHLSSEAYALLKYNAEYLLTKLQEQ